jgi:hypothetical protein
MQNKKIKDRVKMEAFATKVIKSFKVIKNQRLD